MLTVVVHAAESRAGWAGPDPGACWGLLEPPGAFWGLLGPVEPPGESWGLCESLLGPIEIPAACWCLLVPPETSWANLGLWGLLTPRGASPTVRLTRLPDTVRERPAHGELLRLLARLSPGHAAQWQLKHNTCYHNFLH